MPPLRVMILAWTPLIAVCVTAKQSPLETSSKYHEEVSQLERESLEHQLERQEEASQVPLREKLKFWKRQPRTPKSLEAVGTGASNAARQIEIASKKTGFNIILECSEFKYWYEGLSEHCWSGCGQPCPEKIPLIGQTDGNTREVVFFPDQNIQRPCVVPTSQKNDFQRACRPQVVATGPSGSGPEVRAEQAAGEAFYGSAGYGLHNEPIPYEQAEIPPEKPPPPTTWGWKITAISVGGGALFILLIVFSLVFKSKTKSAGSFRPIPGLDGSYFLAEEEQPLRSKSRRG